MDKEKALLALKNLDAYLQKKNLLHSATKIPSKKIKLKMK